MLVSAHAATAAAQHGVTPAHIGSNMEFLISHIAQSHTIVDYCSNTAAMLFADAAADFTTEAMAGATRSPLKVSYTVGSRRRLPQSLHT